MKYDSMVKVNGVYYDAGAEVPEPEGAALVQKTLTKTDINRMNTEDLRAKANEMGLFGADNANGAELKKLLIEQLGL